jgi:UDP-N-acetylglucosamine/UDP-N-acetylgalactosamine diphosphorylase
MNKYRSVVKLLKKYNQEQVLAFYNTLPKEEKELLLDQVLNIDFEKLISLYNEFQKDVSYTDAVITPLEHVEETKLSSYIKSKYVKKGEEIIENGGLAVITLAGGQGTRLGLSLPKGFFEVETNPKKSLFQIQCETLQMANIKYNTVIHWYIMTSPDNDSITKVYFEDKKYFGYGKENVTFFKQDTLPVLDFNSKLILDKAYKVKEVSNGNGDVFSSLQRYGLIEDMEKKGIKYVFIGGIDNILLKTVDPLFIGLCDIGNCKVASKTITKNENEKDEWVFARRDGKPSIVSSKRITKEMEDKKDENGKYLYKEINILAHLFSIDSLKLCANIDLPYHLAEKKNDYLNDEGVKIMPKSPNTYKYEQFIFDVFPYFDNILLLSVKREREFAPIKSFTGIHTPERALELYLNERRNSIKG